MAMVVEQPCDGQVRQPLKRKCYVGLVLPKTPGQAIILVTVISADGVLA